MTTKTAKRTVREDDDVEDTEVQGVDADEEIEEEQELSLDEQAEALIKKNVMVSMGVGLIPAPGVDLVALVGQQLYMAKRLGELYDVEFREDLGRKSVVALLGAAAPSSTLRVAAGSILKSIPVVGHAASAFSMPLLAGAATYAVGNVLNLHFASGGTFLSFDPKRYREQFQNQMADGMDVAKDVDPENS